MCLNPIRVKNPSRFYQDGVSHTFLMVPCGHCHECEKRAEDDWFVRAFFEWRKIKQLKASGMPNANVYFVLLTYDDDHLPHYSDPANDFECPCFNPEHIKHFRDTLRMNLIRDGYPHTDILYKICAEYGGQFGRSHYHCLVFVPHDIPVSYFTGTYSHVTRQLEGGAFRRAWPYGFVSWSKKHGFSIKSDGGIQYAMKYVNKETKWTIKYCIPSYLQMLKDKLCSLSGSDEVEACREKIRAFRRVLPRHFTSVNFGNDIIDTFKRPDGSFDVDALVEGHVDLTKYGKTPSGKRPNWQFNVPMSIMRKICFDCNDGLWTRNDVGVEVAVKRHELSKKYTREKFEPYFNLESAKRHLLAVCPDLMDDVRDDYDIEYDVKEIARLMRGRSLDDLVMFSKVYSGVPLAYDLDDGVLLQYRDRYAHEGQCYNMTDKEHNYYVAMTDGMDDATMMDFFRRSEYDLLFGQLVSDREPDPKHGARCHHPRFASKRTTYGNFSCFEGFDDVLLIIQKWESLYDQCQQHAHTVEKDRINAILALSGSGWTCEGYL